MQRLPIAIMPIVLAHVAIAPPTRAQLPDAADARITSFVDRTMDELGLVPGLSLAVVRGDEVVYERGFGWAGVERGERATPGTVYYVASLSKALTGMAAAVLATEGTLDLDAPITRFFPGVRFEPPLPPADSRTVRHLLNHTPGFLNSTINFKTTFVEQYDEAELVRVLSSYSRPAEGFNYSNMSYALVSYVLGRAAGEPWQDVLAERVFEPVGMTSTTAYASRLPARGLATPYEKTEDGFAPNPPLKTDASITGAGGFFSTASDLARYVIANLNDGRVGGRQALPAAAVREAGRPQASLAAEFFEFERHHYGLGLYIADYDGDTLVHHFGGIPGGFRSHMSFMPEHGIGVVVLQNAGVAGSRLADIVATYVYDLLLGRPDADARARRRLDALHADAADAVRNITARRARLASVAAERAAPTLPLRAYIGTYESARLGRLRVEPTPDGLRIVWGEVDGRLLPAGGHDFLVDWQPGYAPWSWVFDATDDGVTGFRWGNRPFVRVDPAPSTDGGE